MNKDLKDDLITFMTTNEEKIAKQNDKNSFIPLKYIDILNEGLKILGSERSVEPVDTDNISCLEQEGFTL